MDTLPFELWVQIFNNVGSPKDLLNCWNATSAWSAVLRSNDFYFKMTLQFVLPYLSKKDVLKCSSVSKSWNATVDAYVCIQAAEDIDNDRRWSSDVRKVFELRLYTIPAFIKTFSLWSEPGEKTIAVNPVAFRRVAVNLSFHGLRRLKIDQHFNVDPIAVVRNYLIKCLEHHGHLIQYLEIKISGEFITCDDKIDLILTCLKRTPILRALHLTSYASPRNYNGALEAFPDDTVEHPWPALQYLKVLTFGRYTNRVEYASISNAYASQLLHFEFGFQLVEPHRPLSTRFSGLTKIVYCLNESESAMEFGAFVQSCQCPLQQLTVRFDAPGATDLGDENYNGLTIAANATSATLKTIHFSSEPLPGQEINFDINKFNGLRLPKLESMELHAFGYPSVDFLCSVCPALQSLVVIPSIPKYICLKMVKAGEMYSDLYSQHQFWSQLADIKIVDVDYLLESKYIFVDEIGSGIEKKNREWIPGGKQRTIYTRREYKAKVEEDQRNICDGL